jgi:hypothetical protein
VKHKPNLASGWVVQDGELKYFDVVKFYLGMKDRFPVCMHACILTDTHPIDMHASMHVYMHGYVYMHAYMHACMYMCMHACIYVCMHACMYVCMHACMHICM